MASPIYNGVFEITPQVRQNAQLVHEFGEGLARLYPQHQPEHIRRAIHHANRVTPMMLSSACGYVTAALKRGESICHTCGCMDSIACTPPCSWVTGERDLCSRCAAELAVHV